MVLGGMAAKRHLISIPYQNKDCVPKENYEPGILNTQVFPGKQAPSQHFRPCLQVQPENKNKTSIIKGICIARRNKGVRTSFILLNHLGTFGQIERIFPL